MSHICFMTSKHILDAGQSASDRASACNQRKLSKPIGAHSRSASSGAHFVANALSSQYRPCDRHSQAKTALPHTAASTLIRIEATLPRRRLVPVAAPAAALNHEPVSPIYLPLMPTPYPYSLRGNSPAARARAWYACCCLACVP